MDGEKIKMRAKLLQKYLKDEQKELQALYALQALMVQMEQPASEFLFLSTQFIHVCTHTELKFSSFFWVLLVSLCLDVKVVLKSVIKIRLFRLICCCTACPCKDVHIFPSYLTLAYYNVGTVHKVSAGT